MAGAPALRQPGGHRPATGCGPVRAQSPCAGGGRAPRAAGAVPTGAGARRRQPGNAARRIRRAASNPAAADRHAAAPIARRAQHRLQACAAGAGQPPHRSRQPQTHGRAHCAAAGGAARRPDRLPPDPHAGACRPVAGNAPDPRLRSGLEPGRHRGGRCAAAQPGLPSGLAGRAGRPAPHGPRRTRPHPAVSGTVCCACPAGCHAGGRPPRLPDPHRRRRRAEHVRGQPDAGRPLARHRCAVSPPARHRGSSAHRRHAAPHRPAGGDGKRTQPDAVQTPAQTVGQ